MLSSFTPPPSVTCFLCKAWISVKKGDKSRFFNHISSDHEVHFDMELLFVISFMTDSEKETVINLMNQRLVADGGDNEVPGEEISDPVVEVDSEDQVTLDEEEELAKVREIMKSKWTKRAEKTVPATFPVISQGEASGAVEVSSVSKGVMGEDSDVEVMCGRCPTRMTRRTMKKHMLEEHKMKLCRFCEKYMGIGNFSRHLRNQHQKTTLDHDKLVKMRPSRVKVETTSAPEVAPPEMKAPETGAEKSKSKFKRCKLCFKITSVQNFERHLREKHTGVKHKCALCHANFSRHYILKNHVQTNHLEDQHLLDSNLKPTFKKEDCKVFCESCSLRFITVESMKYHVAKSHGSGTRQCKNCQKRFMGSLSLKKHLETCQPMTSS